MGNSDPIVLLDKPSGITSFDCIRRLRPIVGVKKMGHAGTLDPLATGLLVIGVGKEGTRSLNQFKDATKTYEVVARLGVRTTTGDRDGEVIDKCSVDVSDTEVDTVIQALVGTHSLSVPLYSAIKKDGRPLYWYARKGKEIIPPKKEMEVLDSSFKGIERREEGVYLSCSVTVSSGTYVRSLIEEVGRLLGTCATVHALRRTRVGECDVRDAVSLETLEKGQRV